MSSLGAMAGTVVAAAGAQAHAGGGPQYGVGNYNVNYVPNPNPWNQSNFTFDFANTTHEKTSLEVFEELVGLIKLLELKLNLDPKDDSKHSFLEMIMGRIQEETINDTLKRLKALDI